MTKQELSVAKHGLWLKNKNVILVTLKSMETVPDCLTIMLVFCVLSIQTKGYLQNAFFLFLEKLPCLMQSVTTPKCFAPADMQTIMIAQSQPKGKYSENQ